MAKPVVPGGRQSIVVEFKSLPSFIQPYTTYAFHIDSLMSLGLPEAQQIDATLAHLLRKND